MIVKLLGIYTVNNYNGAEIKYFIIWDGTDNGTTNILPNRLNYNIKYGRIESILIENNTLITVFIF